MIIRKMNQTDSREEISNIYEQAGNMRTKGLFRRRIWTVFPKGQWCGAFDNPDRYTLVMLDDEKIIGTSTYCKSRFEDCKDWGAKSFPSIFCLNIWAKGYGKPFA